MTTDVIKKKMKKKNRKGQHSTFIITRGKLSFCVQKNVSESCQRLCLPLRRGGGNKRRGVKKVDAKGGSWGTDSTRTRSTLCSTILYLGFRVGELGGDCLVVMPSGGATKNGQTHVKTNRYCCTLSIRGYTNCVHLPIFSGRQKIMQFFLFFTFFFATSAAAAQ